MSETRDPAYQKLLDEHIARAWPLRFRTHDFYGRCYNTLRCSIIYIGLEHSAHLDEPSGPPPSPDDIEKTGGTYLSNGPPFPPAEVQWTALDGTEHEATIDFETIFKDRLVLHNVAKQDIPEGWLACWDTEPFSVTIALEVNDRTINLYMRAHVTTKEPQIPGNPRSHHRTDLILAWSKTS